MSSDMKYATYQIRDRDYINTAIFEEKVPFSMSECQHMNIFFHILRQHNK